MKITVQPARQLQLTLTEPKPYRKTISLTVKQKSSFPLKTIQLRVDYGTHIFLGVLENHKYRAYIYAAQNGRITSEIPLREYHNGLAMNHIAQIMCSMFPHAQTQEF